MRLFRSMLLLMLVAAVVPTAVAGWLVAKANRDELVTDSLELAGARVERLRLQVSDYLADMARAADGTARGTPWAERDLADRRRAVASLLVQREELAVVTLFDRAGQKIPGLQALPGGEVSPSEVAEHEARAQALLAEYAKLPAAVRAGKRHLWSSLYVARHRREAVLTLVVPVPDDAAVGALAVEVSLAPLQRLFETTRVGARGLAFAVDAQGRYAAHPELSRVLDGEPAVEQALVQQIARSSGAMGESGVARVAEFVDARGREWLGAWAVVPEVGWGIVAEQPRADAFASVRRMRETMLAFGLASLLLSVVLALWFSQRLTRPVGRVVKGALEIARGTFGHQVDVQVKNEVGELAYTFNYMSRELKGYDDENKRLIAALESGYLDTIKSLAGAIDAKDPYTRGHSQRVADLSMEIGRELQCDGKTLRLLEYGGILHDIGKIGIVEPILCKRSRLTDEEMAVMREHPEIGGQIVRDVDFLRDAVPAIRNHHERWDGTGYPDRLAGEAIPIIARIVNCADTWDACTSTRPYQQAMPTDKALEVMQKLRGSQLDPAVHDALVRVIEKRSAAVQRGADKPPPVAEEEVAAAVKESARA